MPHEQDENYWYGSGWSSLRRQLIRLCVAHSEPLFELLDTTTTELPETRLESDFLAPIQAAAEQYSLHDQTGLWPLALPLLGDLSALSHSLNRDLPALRGSKTDIEPEQALRQNLKRFFDQERRKQEYRPNRNKVWERINRISLQLRDLATDRCSLAHQRAVLEHIHEHYAEDHNLPRTLDTLGSYFDEFCTECRNKILDADTLSADDIRLLMQDTDQETALETCLDALQQQAPRQFEVICVSFRLQLGDLVYMNAEAYKKAHRLARRAFEKLRNSALDSLRICIENHL